MNAIDQSSNRIPCHTDWHRYDSPTVLRRHGRSFLERCLNPGHSVHETSVPNRTELQSLVESYGGFYLANDDQILLVFADYHWARRCEQQLVKRGLSTLRLGCYIRLQEQR